MENANINPWNHLWTEPRKTFRAILSTDPKRLILWLALVGGILSSLAFAAISWYPPKDVFHHIVLIVSLVVAGAIFGIVHLYFAGWLLTLTGSWLGGKGNFTDVKCAVGWSNYPFIIADIFALLAVFSAHIPWLKAIFALINLIILAWGLIIFFKIIGEAHQFSAWRGVLAFLIAVVLVFVALMIIALLVPLLAPLFQ